MKKNFHILEKRRLALQAELDGQKTQAERNKLGQFATPMPLAQDILRYAGSLLRKREAIRFLDPAIGTGAFYSALRNLYPSERVAEAAGFEIDAHYERPAAKLWSETGLAMTLADFTLEKPEPRFNMLICNPPYVRHHHLANGEKIRLQQRTLKASGMKLSGLAGLYCHFLGLSHSWMAEDGIAGWLIPSEFMDVNYGAALKHYLLEKVTLLHIHRFDPDDVQFADALVSSAVVWLRNSPPPPNHSVSFTFGGTLSAPKLTRMVSARELAHEHKWTRFPTADVRIKTEGPILSDFFQIKRGIATGGNSFFILPVEEIIARDLPMHAFRPILPSPRYIPGNEIRADDTGNPCLERRLFLLDLRMTEQDIKQRSHALWRYLEEGRAQGLPERYICSHRPLWYTQENRPPAPLLCTYLGRGDTKSGRPFRFLLNHSKATVANVYLAMYPTPFLAKAIAADHKLTRRIWNVLNNIMPEQLLGEGRVYGGGLHKLEPRELANVPVAALAEFLPRNFLVGRQLELSERSGR
jgi:hypothetical protein